MKFRKYTKEQLIEAVSTSDCIAQVLVKLGVSPYGGNYAVVKKYISLLNLDTSHFRQSGRGWSRGRTFPEKKRPIEIYLSNQKHISSHQLKLRLLSEGFFERKCSVCSLDEWMSKPIPLELDHINGDKKNNSIENLRLLCPNCHAQTDTYRGKNIKIGRRQEQEQAATNVRLCSSCGLENKYSRCRKCSGLMSQKTKISWPPLDELISMVNNLGYLEVGRILGVSDSAIRKHIKKRI